MVNWYFQSGVTQFLVERSAYASWNALLDSTWKITCWKIKCFTATHLAYTGQNSLQQYIFDYLSSIFAQNARELKADIPAEEAAKIGQFFCRRDDGRADSLGVRRDEEQHPHQAGGIR